MWPCMGTMQMVILTAQLSPMRIDRIIISKLYTVPSLEVLYNREGLVPWYITVNIAVYRRGAS